MRFACKLKEKGLTTDDIEITSLIVPFTHEAFHFWLCQSFRFLWALLRIRNS